MSAVALGIAARRLVQAPAFSLSIVSLVAIVAAALLTLGTAVSAALWQPLPFPHGDRLVVTQGMAQKMRWSIGFAPGLVEPVARMPGVEAVAVYGPAPSLPDLEGHRYESVRIEPALLAMSGARPRLGLLLGIAAAWACNQLLASRLYRLSPTDPTTLVLVALRAALRLLLACIGPARRAASLDPLATLRHD